MSELVVFSSGPREYLYELRLGLTLGVGKIIFGDRSSLFEGLSFDFSEAVPDRLRYQKRCRKHPYAGTSGREVLGVLIDLRRYKSLV